VSADPLFSTERLHCRRWVADDFDTLYAVYADPEAMKWVGDGSPISREACERWFEVTNTNYARRGYGMFALESRESAQVVGFAGLVHPGGQPEAEIKYAFLRSHWGQGLASEVVPALLRYGAQAHGLMRIIATVARDNLVSQHVLRKSGMVRTGTRANDDGSFTELFEWTGAAPPRVTPP
jgi:RimJ/RimL family protein N-acetyltransferase